MSTSYIEDLRARLRDIELRLAEQRRRLEAGGAETRAQALAELARLELRREELSDRLVRAEEEGAERWSQAYKGFREEVEGLGETVEDWILRLAQP